MGCRNEHDPYSRPKVAKGRTSCLATSLLDIPRPSIVASLAHSFEVFDRDGWSRVRQPTILSVCHLVTTTLRAPSIVCSLETFTWDEPDSLSLQHIDSSCSSETTPSLISRRTVEQTYNNFIWIMHSCVGKSQPTCGHPYCLPTLLPSIRGSPRSRTTFRYSHYGSPMPLPLAASEARLNSSNLPR